jgi:hypothetical protein
VLGGQRTLINSNPNLPPATTKPANLTEPLESADDVFSPRVVASVNDYDVRIALAQGEHFWHVHEDVHEDIDNSSSCSMANSA